MIAARRYQWIWLAVWLLTAVSVGQAEDSVPVSTVLDLYQHVQQPQLQQTLTELFPESEGYQVTGPLWPGNGRYPALLQSVRIICPDQETYLRAVDKLDNQIILPFLSIEKHDNTTGLYGYRGALVKLDSGRTGPFVQINTTQQTRWLIWASRSILVHSPNMDTVNDESRRVYSQAVSDYLYVIDTGNLLAEPPAADDYGVPDEWDFYGPPPQYVIEGYENYRAFMHAHREIKLDFASGVTNFVATDEILKRLKENAPETCFRNKEAAFLQQEYREFFERGGDVREMNTLTQSGLDTLSPGEYLYTVSVSGSIRFVRELSRREAAEIEKRTGRAAARANHAFLFPGEPVLTAGAFFVETLHPRRISRVNIDTGHYFFSNSTPSIREDIAVHSDYYLLSLGHFFRALDSLGIGYDDILVSKL
ncbi:MAG: hypothetical protein ABII79_09500 [bacterium]